MKLLSYLLIAIVCLSCRSKSVTVEKSYEKEKESFSKFFDSLVKQSIQNQYNWQQRQNSFTNSLLLRSSNDIDSLGNKKPFHFKHYIDGDLKEELWVQGGEIESKSESKERQESETKLEQKNVATGVKVQSGHLKNNKKGSGAKAKEVDVTGFQFGFYIWLFLLIIILALLSWMARRFKLFDKFKSFFSEEKKPSDI